MAGKKATAAGRNGKKQNAAKTKVVQSPKKQLATAVKVALPRESSPDEQDLAPTDSEADDDVLEFDDDEEEDEAMQPLSGEDDSDDDEEEDSGDESDDVTPEAMERMMSLLGEVDAAELGLLDGQDDDDEEEDDDDEDDDEEEDDEEEEEEATALYEELEEADTDVVPVEKNTTNDKVALERVLASIQLKTNFFDTLTLVNPVPLHVPDASNDLERELEFYKQSLWAATHAEALFEKADLPFHRPADYFAEMVKTDAHMGKIRQSLLDEQAGMKASEEARKLRELKKFGKKVQVEKIREREREKKAVGERLDSLKKKRKNGDAFTSTEDFDVALEDALAGGAAAGGANKKQKMNESERPGRGRKGLTRKGRDSKFGFGGGAGRRSKENNDREDGDGFGGGRGAGRGRGGGRGGRGGARGGRGRGGAAKQRPGKSRRQ